VNPARLEHAQADDRMQAVLQLAQSCRYETEHAHQVTRLALRLFDELQPLHSQGDTERFWLQCGALLHDIGWVKGQQKHHKTSLQIILNAPSLPFDERERLIIASIARYHRKALPHAGHAHFAALEEADQHIVKVLAGMLRVADGLDRTHWCVVNDLSCEISATTITIRCAVNGYAEPERLEALEKGGLLEQVFNRQLAIEWHLDRASRA